MQTVEKVKEILSSRAARRAGYMELVDLADHMSARWQRFSLAGGFQRFLLRQVGLKGQCNRSFKKLQFKLEVQHHQK